MESDQISMSIPSLHAHQMIWSESTLKSIQSQDDSYSNRFSSANAKFKDPFLLSHIKPDYGSLGQFMTNIDINKDFLMQKKKKNQGQDQYEEKKVRNFLKNKDLQQVLKSQNSNPLQRSVACKIMIQKIFEEAFGTDINKFYTSNNKTQNPKKSSLNINNLSQALDNALQRKSSTKNSSFNESLLLNNKNIRKKKSFLTKEQIIQNQKEDRMKKIEQIKNSYKNLVKFPICVENQEIQLPKCIKTKEPESPVKKVKIFKMFQQENFQLNETTLRIQYLQNLQIKNFVSILGKINYENIQRVQIIKTNLMEDAIFLLCDLIIKFSRKLKILTFQEINFKNSQKLSYKIKQIFQTNNLTHVKLNKLGLQTKDFCVICLGIGYSKQLQCIQMKDNEIDENGKKSYDVIVKFFKNMHFNIEGNILAKEVNKLKSIGSKAIIK